MTKCKHYILNRKEKQQCSRDAVLLGYCICHFTKTVYGNSKFRGIIKQIY